MSDSLNQPVRKSLGEPVAAIRDAARYLDAAVSAHLAGQRTVAKQLFALADMPEIRAWTYSMWADSSVHLRVPTPESPVAKALRPQSRMPTEAIKRAIHGRDGYSCRFCGIPVIRAEVRKRISLAYPDVVRWSGVSDKEKHAAFQTMWAQYDHIVPHAHAGSNELENLVLACAPCNFGRAGYTLKDVAVSDPREQPIDRSHWDGLERFK